MAQGLQALSQLLQATLDPNQSKQAEATIREEELKPAFSLSLLQIVASDTFPLTTRLASALFFKNFVKRSWVDIDGNYKLPENEVVAIKQELVGLMTSTPPAIQSQLGDTVSIIAESDFWRRWDTLVDDLVSRLTRDNTQVNNGVLQVAHSIFKKWRPLYRSDELFLEILHVLEKFCGPFLTLLENVDVMITENKDNKAGLQDAFSTLNLMLKIFYDLSCQDLPPQFEDQLTGISKLLHKYLTYDNALLHTEDDSESGPLEYSKAEIFEVLVLYKVKYGEAFEDHLAQFVGPSWSLLSNIGTESKYDVLVSKALQFLTTIVGTDRYAQEFSNPETLGQVVEKVILPNLTLRESDVELFEDEPIEFIRRDLEGSDSETRRRAATDFLRVLLEKFEELVTSVVSQYMNHYLEDYSKDPRSNWKSKDTAIYLFSSIAARGAVTAAKGVQTTNSRIDILDFFQKNIASDLSSDNIHVIIKVDAIKFVNVFRSQLTPEYCRATFPLVVKHLASAEYVVHTYAAIAVERMLLLTDDNKQPLIARQDVVALSQELLQHLFKLMRSDPKPEKVQENEFLMRCVMRVLFVSRDGIVPFADDVSTNLIEILTIIQHNPSNPRFYYYHFESLGALIRYAAPTNPKKFEDRMFRPFASILASETQEFEPYIFQLFAALLDSNPSEELPPYYSNFIAGVLQPKLWESKGNVPALVRLLCSVVTRGKEMIIQDGLLTQILGIFQKMIASKVTESYAFDLIEAITSSIPASALQTYFKDVLSLMLTRLSNSKTENLELRFVRFYHYVAARDDKGLGADFYISISDQVQHDVFRSVYTQFILPDTQKLTRTFDRKTAVVSLTETLADSEAFVSRYPKGWTLTCETLLKLLVNPPIPHEADTILVERDLDELGFSAGFTPLTTCAKPPQDPFPEIADVKAWAGQYLKAANERHKGRIGEYVQSRLSAEAQQALASQMRL